MPTCKGLSKIYYTGNEPTPKGLGFCARSEKVGKRRRGNDGEMWMVHEDSIGRLAWKRIRRGMKTPGTSKRCRRGTVLNPSTNRCVLKHGRIGQRLFSRQGPRTPRAQTPRARTPRTRPRTPRARTPRTRPRTPRAPKVFSCDSIDEFERFLSIHAKDVRRVLLLKYSKRDFRLQFHPDRCINSSNSIHALFAELGLGLDLNVSNYRLVCEAIYKKFSSLY